MTSIVVATRDGILTGPDGTNYRLVRGKTLGDARHPAIAAYPDNFMPVEIELSHDAEAADPGHLEDDFAVELAELQEEKAQADEAANGYMSQLAAIADLLAERGMVPDDTGTEGWLTRAVAAALDRDVSRETSPTPADDEDDIPPPVAARKPRGKTPAAG